jgi:hypothetical protein
MGFRFATNIEKIDPPLGQVKAAMRLECLLDEWGIFASEGEQDA